MAILLILLWLLTCQAEFQDEIQKYEQSCLGGDVFQCFNGTCIPKSRYCDGISDCNDGSDESFCLDPKILQFCSEDLDFLCADHKKCLFNSLVCNNISECDDGSDEKNCSFTSTDDNNGSCKGFSCDGFRCISPFWICDTRYDCVDKSDESFDVCRHKKHAYDDLYDLVNCGTVKELPDGAQKSYRCLDSSYCLPSAMMCDSMVDCRDGSDEGEFCDNWNTVCSSNPCKGNNTKCIPERYDYFCTCDDSTHQYNHTTNQCERFNVCESPRPYCSQMCEVDEKGFKCVCDKGYTLGESGFRCHAGDPEAMLFYSTPNQIRYITLTTKKHVTVATGMKQTHGVTSDGKFLFWVETAQGHQAIMRANMENVTETKQVLVSLGLEEPGDIALDWLGGHIYFTDAMRGIIAVCRTDGSICATLPVIAYNPKYIALAVKYGKMYWADYLHKPMIKTARMDGTGSEVLVSNLSKYATGLTLDVPNNRLYYLDHSIKVVRIDNKQTYTLISEGIYHPYAIAVFENSIYWSDMVLHNIQICDKMHRGGELTQKLISTNSSVFDMHIYHPLLIGQFGHDSSPCLNKSCSHLCLLTSDVTATCACPDGMKLNGTTCYHMKNHKPQYLIIGAGTEFTRMQYNSLGNPETHATHLDIGRVQAMAYDNVRDTLYIYDAKYKTIECINMSDFTLGVTQSLLYRGIDDIVDMDYDYATDSLYVLDAGRRFLEVVSLRTHQRALIHLFREEEILLSFCIIPEYGKMLIAIREGADGDIHIDSMGLDGSERKHVIDNGLKGPTIRLRYAHNTDTVYFFDEGNGIIDIINPEGEGRENFKTLTTTINSLAVTEYLFWTDRQTQRLFWASVHDIRHKVRRFEFSIFSNDSHLHIQSTRPPPDPNNLLMKHPCLLPNTCSDVCVQTPHPHPTSKKNVTLGYKCLCPPSLLLVDGKCTKLADCGPGELYCHKSNDCIRKAKRCDGKQDCRFGEDEEGCNDNDNETPKVCAPNEISCNGGCIDKKLSCNPTKDGNQSAQCEATQWPCKTGSLCVERSQVCDRQKDCPDGTDEDSAVCDTMSCLDHEFRCTVGSCIPSTFRCDGELDCSDGSDEENCDDKNCTVGHYQCRNKQCIELHKRCDGQQDCVDYSDEEQCEESVTEEKVTQCAEEEYACALNTSICLPATARCNWKVDCPGGTDEIDCDRCTPRGQFKCAQEFKCVPRKKVCDGTKECKDGSDETPEACQFVNRTSHPRKQTPLPIEECNHGYVCDTGDCLEWRQVCDNIVDCYDGSDEEGQCSSACRNTTCSHICQPTPRGRLCKCPHGLQLQVDHRTCVDIDECTFFDDVCPQVCRNLPGGFLCSCHHGYTLRADRRSCKAIKGTMSILYVSGNTVRSLSADGNSELEYYDQNITRIGGIDANIREHKLYVTAPDAGKLIQVNNYGPNVAKNVTVVTNIGTPTKVAVDWLTGNVYFVDRTNGKNSFIRVCNVDEKKCAMLQQTSLAEGAEVTALVVDPASRRIFYCATHEGESVVWSYSLSGGSRTNLATFGNCTGLAVDSFKRRLYVAETRPAQITRMDFFGDKHKTVVADHPNLESPQGLVIFEDWIYFRVANSIKLNRCRLYGSKTCQVFQYRMFDANTFVIRHPSVQRNDLTNACADYVCSNICVLDDIGPQCLCYDGTIAKNGNCAEPTQTLEPIIDGISVGSSRVNEVTITVISAILFLLALYFGIYVYYRCVARRNNNSNYVEVRFQNNPSTANIEPFIEMPTNTISGASSASAYEFANPLQYVRNLMYGSYRRTTRPIGTAGLQITVPNIEVSSDTESDVDDKDTNVADKQIME